VSNPDSAGKGIVIPLFHEVKFQHCFSAAVGEAVFCYDAHGGASTMVSQRELCKNFLDQSFQVLDDNLVNLTLEEALSIPHRGYRSILGTLKHIAAWAHVYRSYAFDPQPVHWKGVNWPRGLRETVVKSKDYLDEVIGWLTLSRQMWKDSLSAVEPAAVFELRPVHWGEVFPLYEIVLKISNHTTYHAGEINQLLSIAREEAWEIGEEVEENLVSTIGHRVIPPWRRDQ
jgi:hypothetical protein